MNIILHNAPSSHFSFSRRFFVHCVWWLIDFFTSHLEFSNNWYGSTKLFMNHKSKNSHHGSTSVVKLNSTLEKLLLFIEIIPSEVKRIITEVTNELSSSDVFHYEKLEDSNKGNNLKKPGLGDGVDGGPTVRDGVKGSSSLIYISWKVDSGTGYNLSKECKHRNTSVLDFNITKTIEFLLVGISQKSQGVLELQVRTRRRSRRWGPWKQWRERKQRQNRQ